VIDKNVDFFKSKGFYTNTNFNKKIEYTMLAQGNYLISATFNFHFNYYHIRIFFSNEWY